MSAFFAVGLLDTAATKYSWYITEKSPLLYYPTRSFVDRYNRINSKNITIQNNILTLKLSNTLPDGYSLNSDWLSEDIFPQFMKDLNYDLSTEELSLPYQVGSEVYMPIASVSAMIDVSDAMQRSLECGQINPNSVSEFSAKNGVVSFAARDGASCGHINFPNQEQDFGNILMLEAKNETGLPMRICITNKLSRKCDIYTALDRGNAWKTYYFMIPPQPSGDSGYAVHFNTISIGNTLSMPSWPSQMRF